MLLFFTRNFEGDFRKQNLKQYEKNRMKFRLKSRVVLYYKVLTRKRGLINKQIYRMAYLLTGFIDQ